MARASGRAAHRDVQVYHYDPESEANPRIDTFEVDLDECGPMVFDALIWIKNKVDSTLAFRRSYREGVCGSCAMNMDRTNWLACTRFISDMSKTATSYPLANLPITKDLVPDTTHLFAQYEIIEPWLHAETPIGHSISHGGFSTSRAATNLQLKYCLAGD